MFLRAIRPDLESALAESPAVALLGPRQAGKTTLAQDLGHDRPSVYLDLETPSDRARLSDPEAFLSSHRSELVILDEVHRLPELLPLLRGQIDQARREGRRVGLYLLLGSVGLDLVTKSGESLAGRIAYLELPPLQLRETGAGSQEALWLRGGFPDSFLSTSDEASLRWRQNFLRTYIERDIPQLGPRLPAETLRHLWSMLAHLQGSLLNSANLTRSLGIDVRTTNRYLDLLVDLLLLRRLPPWHENVGKRLVRSPKVYVRDSGLVHALLGIANLDALLGHPIVGASYEGFAIENLLKAAPPEVTPYFYRTAAGAEIDLLLLWPDGARWAIEIKRSLAPKPERGFHEACRDLRPNRKFLVHPGTESWPMAEGLEAIDLPRLCAEIGGKRGEARNDAG